MAIHVEFRSPPAGSSVPTTFTVAGVWFHDGAPPPIPGGEFTLASIFVRFAPGSPNQVATVNEDGTWAVTGSLPGGTHHGDGVVVSFEATVIFFSNEHPNDGFTQILRDNLNLVVEIPDQVLPVVTIDAFDDDETVDTPPFRVPLLSGHAADSSGIALVQYTIGDNDQRLNMDSVTGDPANVTWAKANLEFDVGRHRIRVFATDTRGNEGMATAFVSVRTNTPPAPKELAFATTTYLSELLGLASRDLRIGGATSRPTIADIAARLRQPLAAIISPATHAEAIREVAQPRLAIEVLRSQFITPPPVLLEQEFRFSVYQAFLRTIGTDFQELRLARGATPQVRQALAARLGILVNGIGTQRLDELLLEPLTMTEGQLETLFGFRSTTPDDLTAAHPTASVLLWRRDAQRHQWFLADQRERDLPGGALPVIDPDLVDDTDFVVRELTNPAYVLWVQRGQLVATMVADIAAALSGPNRTLAGFDAAVADATRTNDGRTLDIVALSGQEAAGVDIRAQLPAFGVTLDGFHYLARLRTLLAAASTLTESEWRDIVSILVQSRKRRLARPWRLDELGAHVTLAPGTFVVDTPLAAPGPDDPLRWRRLAKLRLDWLRTVHVRAKQADDLDAGWQADVDAVEERTLPVLRDALIAELGRRHTPVETSRQTAERLSRQLCIDLQAAAATRTSRVTQAIDSVQVLLIGARSGVFAGPGGDRLDADSETSFDLEFAWLSSYPRWRAAITSFAYPENQLRPNVFVEETVTNDILLAPTHAYQRLLGALATRPQLSPDDARNADTGLAARYLADLRGEIGELPPGLASHLPLTDRRTNAELLEFRAAAVTILATAGPFGGAITIERDVPQYLREIYWLVPMALAAKLQESGHYQTALDWYRTVFSFQLPPEQRLIYPGLQFESTLTSDFGRLPDWLAQTAELNPHLTARKRNRAYTKHTVMAIVRCFLAFGDAEFSRGTPDSNARAQTLYQTAADLLELREAAPDPNEDTPFPINPVWQSLRDQAAVGLSKIHAGLNLAGQTDLDAAKTTTLPSQYRYSVLVERARSLVTTAQQVEAAYLSALVQGDNAAYSEAQAQRDLAAAGAMLGVEDLKVATADIAVTQAQAQRDRAVFQQDHFDDLISAGLTGHEQDQLFGLRMARELELGSAALRSIGLALPPLALSSAADTAAALSSAASLDSQIDGLEASFERREEEWLFQRANALRDVAIGELQIGASRTQQQIAVADRNIAGLRLQYAAETADFLATKFTNRALFEWMSGVLGGVYAYFLQQATTLAQLAQAQLAFERQEPSRDVIQRDYWQGPPNPSTLADSPDRRGLTAAERLLQDITRLDQFAFDTDRRKLQLTQTLSLSRVASAELQQFRQTGVLTFATPQSLFDADFPGHYLRLVKRVKLSVLALLPPIRGLRATLSASGISRAVVARDTFDTVTLRRDPESIAFTSAVNANGLFEFAPEDGKLLPFEGMGVDTIWRLEMPKPANPFNYRTVADVLLTIEYTALDSTVYRQHVIQTLASEVRADRSFSVRDDFPDVWFALNNPDTVEAAQRMVVTLPLTADDFPRNVADLQVAELTLFVLRASSFDAELDIRSVRHSGAEGVVEAGAVRTVDGIVGTRRPGGAPWQVFAATGAAGAWELRLDDTALVRSWFLSGQIEDLVLVFTLSGAAPQWP
ncbi:hypothetical protein Rhe02_42140 [Rhizocola hellebori]|uniref:Tc toxin complex TcA C-terminal TcB-binding domain-containing protein n=1 Tax=Rhizocola hellebori TaxID=1392758 RepID=A0A8J3VHD9_9ACTN|nr:neuraminidase-like domain-containing protein [Rhizocola hellebori]GIH06147.1 hypothetical protein Rhe02_42140 [Rhizocola hellebori]